MTARIFEFKPQNTSPKEAPKNIDKQKGQTIPLGLGRLENMSDSEEKEIIRKLSDFKKLKLRFNKSIYTQYYNDIDKSSLDQIVDIVLKMNDQDLQNRPAYTEALFDVISKKLGEVNK